MSTQSNNKFIMLCGLPGSGKSCLARNLTDENTVWISSDKIREELYGSEEKQGDANVVFDEMKKRTIASLKDHKNVIYDACNISSKKRVVLVNELKKNGCTLECIICATHYEKCLERNYERERVVDKSIIKRMYMNWNIPCYYEGWDKISIEYADDSRKIYGSIDDFIDRYKEYSQDSPYHLETLGDHLFKTGDYLIKKYGYADDSNLVLAARLHDCGKPFTKDFKDSRGNPCDIAHYYQHQCVGAYDCMFFDYGDKTEEDVLKISCLIQLHMIPFNINTEKSVEKFKKLWGNELYDKVTLLHEADVDSSKE